MSNFAYFLFKRKLSKKSKREKDYREGKEEEKREWKIRGREGGSGDEKRAEKYFLKKYFLSIKNI